jgi:hypothetical protein
VREEAMRMRTVLVGAALAVTVVACGSGMGVLHEYSPTTSPKLRAYETFNWLPHPGGSDTRPTPDVVGRQVQRMVDSVLLARGFEMTVDNPDFLLGQHVAYPDELDAHSVNTYFGYGLDWWGGPDGPGTRQEFPKGALIIDVVDGAENQLVWRGAAAANIEPGSADVRERNRRTKNAVDQILRDFPPKVTDRPYN